MKTENKKLFKKIFIWKNFFTISFMFILTMPASTDYKLKDYSFGGGGTKDAASSNYLLKGITGETSGNQLSGSLYNVGPGLIFTNQANVPAAPTFNNPENFYNKLKIIINTSGNPADTKYAIAISDDNFTTTKYVQSDNTVGSTLDWNDYQSYADWGGMNGEFIVGLKPETEYKVKVKAIQGIFTETGYGPVATASTVSPMLSFDIDVSTDNSETNPPFFVNFGDLSANSVINSPEKIWVDFSTNGESGGKVYIFTQNGGLLSNRAGYQINSVSGNLASLSEGFGAQGFSATQDAGGPFIITNPYNQTGDIVGVTDQSVRDIFTSSNPIVNGRGSFLLKAKSSSITPAANDYSELFTVIVSGNF